MVLAASPADLASTVVCNPAEYHRRASSFHNQSSSSSFKDLKVVVPTEIAPSASMMLDSQHEELASEKLNQRLAAWCVMSPSSRRQNEIACLEIDAQLNKFSLAALPNTQTKRYSKSDELRSNKALVYSNNTRWGAFTDRIKSSLTTTFHKSEKKKKNTLTQLKIASLEEELEEFICDPELRMLKFPEYFSKEDRLLLENTAKSIGLGYQIGGKYQVVHKANLSSSRQSAIVPTYHSKGNQESCCTTPRGGDDVSVNVPELALKGHDCFIKSLRLKRLDSAGGNRRNLLWEVAQSSRNEVATMQGCGGVYAMKASDGHEVAMFKPIEEERFVREGLCAGEGAVREEAAYVLDSSIGGFSGVPPTAVAKLQLPTVGKVQRGAVQRFMSSKMGSLEDFGMPRDAELAANFVPVHEVQKVGFLDVRLFNTDRHPGNILLLGDKAPYNLVPIDHGCILPSWFVLSEARFDWVSYPQAAASFSPEMVNKIKELDSNDDAKRLRRLGFREECVMTMRICTMVLKVATVAGKNLEWLARFMQRPDCLQKPSRLEKLIHEACEEVDIPFRFIANEHGEATGVIEAGILSRRPPNVFLEVLSRMVTAECSNDSDNVIA